jgi:hypothetical protein
MENNKEKKELKHISLRVDIDTYKKFKALCNQIENKDTEKNYTASEMIRKFIKNFVDERLQPKLPGFDMETKKYE